MDAVSSTEPQLNAIVKQYVEYMKYAKTLAAFEKELSCLGKSLTEPEVIRSQKDENVDIKESLISCFNTGNFQHFFKLWESIIPKDVQNKDLGCQKLEFNLHLYFAVYAIVNDSGKMEVDKRMQHFKTYLETKGSSLSQTTEFLPYYALPFVPNPKEHPSFKPLFHESWKDELKDNFHAFLSKHLKSDAKPELFHLYSSRPELQDKERQKYTDHIKVLQTQLSEAESKLLRYCERFSQMQVDYHKLIGIAAELVDSLEDTIRGKTISPEYIQDLCTRLFNSPAQQSIDVLKPGTTSNMLRASIIVKSSQSVDMTSDYLPLNFEKIKNNLVSLPERKKGFLLQALRWRLTRSVGEEHRNSTMRAYIGNDLLGCAFPGKYQDTLLDFLNSSSAVVCEYFARLLNTMASLSAGRSYLSQSVKLVEALQNALTTSGSTDSLTSENILGCLQKLSLRRHLQSVMIENDLISWLIDVLEEHDSLSDYNLEYSVALLMNLCLRTSGKKKCSKDAAHILRVLSDLLGHENQEIRPYVNGSLYSILALPDVREEARAMGMQEILECFLKDDDLDMQRQVQFIIKQLNLSTEDSVINYDAQSDDEEDDLDEEGDAIDEELDKQEILDPASNELTGDELLTKEYSVVPNDVNNLRKSRKNHLLIPHLDEPLSRPVTPAGRAQEHNKLDNGPRPTTTVISRAPENPSKPTRSSGAPENPSKPARSSGAPENPSKPTRSSGAPQKPTSSSGRPQSSGSRPTSSAEELSQSQEEEQKDVFAKPDEKRNQFLQSNLSKSDVFATRNKLRRSHDSRTGSPRPDIPPLTRSVSPPPPKTSSRPNSANTRR